MPHDLKPRPIQRIPAFLAPNVSHDALPRLSSLLIRLRFADIAWTRQAAVVGVVVVVEVGEDVAGLAGFCAGRLEVVVGVGLLAQEVRGEG